ncbi:hypothetical protein LINPERHAP2_LOCUS326, partial [Linum perenne]
LSSLGRRFCRQRTKLSLERRCGSRQEHRSSARVVLTNWGTLAWSTHRAFWQSGLARSSSWASLRVIMLPVARSGK